MWAEGDLWSTTVQLPLESNVEFKFVRMDDTGAFLGWANDICEQNVALIVKDGAIAAPVENVSAEVAGTFAADQKGEKFVSDIRELVSDELGGGTEAASTMDPCGSYDVAQDTESTAPSPLAAKGDPGIEVLPYPEGTQSTPAAVSPNSSSTPA